MMEIIERAAHKVPWFEKIYFEGNVGGTDDAAAMMTRVQQHGGKGTYIGIGTDTTAPVHNAEFDLDEDCILAAEICACTRWPKSTARNTAAKLPFGICIQKLSQG